MVTAPRSKCKIHLPHSDQFLQSPQSQLSSIVGASYSPAAFFGPAGIRIHVALLQGNARKRVAGLLHPVRSRRRRSMLRWAVEKLLLAAAPTGIVAQ